MKTGVLAFALLLTATSLADAAAAKEDDNRITARLTPRSEVPAVSSTARGAFRAEISEDGMTITYELRFELEGDVTQSHLHFAQPNVNGGIVVWLCGTPTNPGPPSPPNPATVPVPPSCGGPKANTVTGMLTPANVITVGTQGIAVGEFSELISAIRNGLVYVNVHSTQSPGGEIRGQLKADD